MFQYQIDIRKEDIHFVLLKRFFTDAVGIGFPQVIDTKILYRYDERNQYLDQMIAETFRYLGSPPLGV